MRHPLAVSTFDTDDIEAAIAVLRSGKLTMGEQCAEFEKEFAQYVGTRNAIFVNSGSSANLLAIFALREWATPGTEIIVPALTWATTVWPIAQAGFIPVLVDSDPETLQVSEESIFGALNDNTTAVFIAHIMGNATELSNDLLSIQESGTALIEDCCEALGVGKRNQHVGTFGEAGTFSFYFSHHMTTIEGGMVITGNDDDADVLRALRAHGWVRDFKKKRPLPPHLDPRYCFTHIGFNLRNTEINGALGRSQLRKLNSMNFERNQAATYLNEMLPPNLQSMKITDGTLAAWFAFPLLCESESERDRLRAHLDEREIEHRPIICGNLARHPAMSKIQHLVHGDLAGANKVMDTGLYIGLHPGMNVEYVTNALVKFIR